MTYRVLSVLPRRRNIFIFVFVIGAATVVGNPPLRARLSEAVIARIPNFGQAPPILDPAALKTDNQVASGSSRGAKTASRGDVVPDAVAKSSSSPKLSGQLQLESSDDVAGSGGSDLAGDDDSKAPSNLLAHHGASGLGAFPSPIGRSGGGYGAMGGGGGGGGVPGGFSPGVRSDFNHDTLRDGLRDAEDDRRIVVVLPRAAERVRVRSNAHALDSKGVPFDPNTPFGDSDLTKVGDEGKGPEAGLDANQISAAPLAAPEPGTLLLVANGVVAALGSRAWRRRRKR